MKLYRVEWRSDDGWQHSVDHFKSKREALREARALLREDPDGEIAVLKVDTHKATPFAIAKAFGERRDDSLTVLDALSAGFSTEEIEVRPISRTFSQGGEQ